MAMWTPDIEPTNYTHMFDFQDLRGDNTEMCVDDNSIFGYINSHKEHSKFKKIIERAKLCAQLNQKQADFTVFVPDDRYLGNLKDRDITNMDIGGARQIVMCSMVKRKINKFLITSSPVAYYTTENPEMRMYVTNIYGQTVLNNCAKITKYDIQANNGLIHVTDNILYPNYAHFMN